MVVALLKASSWEGANRLGMGSGVQKSRRGDAVGTFFGLVFYQNASVSPPPSSLPPPPHSSLC